MVPLNRLTRSRRTVRVIRFTLMVVVDAMRSDDGAGMKDARIVVVRGDDQTTGHAAPRTYAQVISTVAVRV